MRADPGPDCDDTAHTYTVTVPPFDEKEGLAGNFDKARQIHYKLLPLIKAMFLETNPIPIKTAMGLAGHCGAEMRLPLCAMSTPIAFRATI